MQIGSMSCRMLSQPSVRMGFTPFGGGAKAAGFRLTERRSASGAKRHKSLTQKKLRINGVSLPGRKPVKFRNQREGVRKGGLPG